MISEPIYQAMVRDSRTRSAPSAMATPIPAIRSARRWRSKTLKIYEERDIVEPCPDGRPAPSGRAAPLQPNHPLVGEVRGIGLIAGVEIVADKACQDAVRPQAGRSAATSRRFAQEHGLIVRAMGDSIGFSPPLIITSAELDDLVTRFGKALDDTVGFVTDQGLAAVA